MLSIKSRWKNKPNHKRTSVSNSLIICNGQHIGKSQARWFWKILFIKIRTGKGTRPFSFQIKTQLLGQ